MIESFVPIFDPQSGDFKGEIRDLEKENVSVAVICHGSEIRRPDSHLERHKYSYFSEGSPTWVSRLRDLTSRNQALIAETGLPVFVSTPDLLLDVPSARWLPLCVDLEMWRCERPALERTRPVVLHLPSRRNPPIKGTQYIDPVLTDLEARGLIRYLHPESVPHSSMSALVQEADIIVDQILTGSYGVAAIEGMAAGRVVVGFVSPETRNLLPEAPPIVDASPANLRETIESLIEDREMGSTLASSGLRYSERWHNGAASTKALSGYLGGI